VWAWISYTFQAKKTKRKVLRSPLKKKENDVVVDGGWYLKKKKVRRSTTSAARFFAAWRLSSGVILGNGFVPGFVVLWECDPIGKIVVRSNR
jgi:hypothetical protein